MTKTRDLYKKHIGQSNRSFRRTRCCQAGCKVLECILKTTDDTVLQRLLDKLFNRAMCRSQVVSDLIGSTFARGGPFHLF